MTLRQGTLVPIERDRTDLTDTAPRAVFFVEESAGVYVIWTGNKTADADAYLKEESADVYVLDSDSAEEDKVAYEVSTSVVII